MTRTLTVAAVCLFVASSGLAQETTRKEEPPSHGTAKAADHAASTPVSIIDIGYKIGPEDVLDISVWKSPELSRSVPVRPDGKVSLPLVNDIQAAGLTPEGLRRELTTRLSDFIPSPEVAVIVREVHSAKVAVVGAVRTPGRFEMRSPATVLEMIAMAQGFTDFADRDRIVVLRQSGGAKVRIPFRYTKVETGTEQDNFALEPGDIIVVP
jgi:polysaccharide export outer membrane protein